MDRAPTTVRLAGTPSLLPSGQSEAVPLTARDAALLVWLALEGPTLRLRVLELLWPDSDVDAARNALRQRLFRMRRAAGADVVTGQDVLRLAEGTVHDLEDVNTVLGHLPSPVGGEFARWLEGQRARRRLHLVQALSDLVQQAEQSQNWPEALGHARDLLAQEPLSELAHRRVMRLHYLAGDRAAALLAFDHCERVLKNEIGAAPSPETLALLRTVEQADASALPAPSRVPPSVLRPPRLVGREAQRAAMQEAWQTGQRVLLLGDAGMGKTRLATDFAMAQGAVVISGARPGDADVAYASFSRLLRSLPASALAAQPSAVRHELSRLLPELGIVGAAPAEMERSRFVNAAIALFEGLAFVIDGIVFDDLHFADDASIELLRLVSAGSRLRWIVTGRAAEVKAGPGALLEAFEAGTEARRIVLPPLSATQVAELVASLGLGNAGGRDHDALAAQLWRRSGGNPLWLLETVKAWLGACQRAADNGALVLPAAANVMTLIERRISQLSPAAVQLARCAAIAAPDFSIELATTVLGVRTLALADPLAELEAAQVLDDGAFVHDLVYESALASVPHAIARRLHAEIAGYLSTRGGEPARVAAHWLAAGDEANALDALLLAAAKARASQRKHEEMEALRTAADVADRLGLRERAFDAVLLAFEAMMVADRKQIDAALLTRLASLADAPVQRLRVLLARASLGHAVGDYAQGLEAAGAAAVLARQLGMRREEIEALRGAAASASFSGDNARALRLLRPALPLLLADGSAVEQQSYFNDLACCLDNADQHDEAETYHRRALELALQTGRLDQASIACANMGHSLRQQGRFIEAFGQVQQARRYVLAFDEADGATWNLDMMSLALQRDLGRYDEALRFGEAALQSIKQNPGAQSVLQHHRVLLWIVLGQFARASQLLDEIDVDKLPPFQRGRWHQLRGRLQRCMGHGAHESLAIAVQEIPKAGRGVVTAMVKLDHSLTLEPADALVVCDAVLAQAHKAGHAGVMLAAQCRAAHFALSLGDVGQAATLGQRALDGLARDVSPDDLYRGEAWLVATRAFDAANDRVAAVQVAAAGVRWVQAAAGRLPAEFRPSFLERNPVNRELLALAGRLGG